MEKVKQILEKVLNGIDLSTTEILYLQEHLKEVKETHNIELIKLATIESDHDFSYRFDKII